MIENPTVFISYSHDDDEHIEWVKKMSADLRWRGVNVILDQLDLRLGHDLRFFMERGSKTSSFVLCVCSENYVQKSNNGDGGVGYESTVISFPLLSNSNINSIIPIIKNNLSNEKTPTFLQSKKYIDFSNENEYYEKYLELISRVCETDELNKPPLGKNPFGSELSKQITINTNIDSMKYKSHLLSGSIIFECSNNNSLFTLGSGEYTFETHWQAASNEVAHVSGNVGFNEKFTVFPEYKDIIDFNFSSSHRSPRTEDIVVWRNQNGKFMATKLMDVKSRSHGKHHDEVTFEYKMALRQLLGWGQVE